VFIVFPSNTPEGKLFCGGTTGVGATVGVLALGFFVPGTAGEAFGVAGVGEDVVGSESVATDASCGGWYANTPVTAVAVPVTKRIALRNISKHPLFNYHGRQMLHHEIYFLEYQLF
jgi:hypothetical protein